MKGLILWIILICLTGELAAQKSSFFSYDRERVNLVMDQINETGTTAGSWLSSSPDYIPGKEVTGFGYFLTGCTLEGLGVFAGILFGLIVYYGLPALGWNSAWPGAVAGGIVGSAVPLAVVGFTARNPKKVFITGAGSVVGAAVCIAVLIGLYKGYF